MQLCKQSYGLKLWNELCLFRHLAFLTTALWVMWLDLCAISGPHLKNCTNFRARGEFNARMENRFISDYGWSSYYSNKHALYKVVWVGGPLGALAASESIAISARSWNWCKLKISRKIRKLGNWEKGMRRKIQPLCAKIGGFYPLRAHDPEDCW